MEDKCLSLDIISSLPPIIIETILCLVPIRDAVRTSILSRNWRYKWVRIPILLFNPKDMFVKSVDEHQLVQPSNERKQLTKKCKVFYAIYQVLLLHQGPILEFTLSMKADYSCVEIDQIILHLSMKNTVKKLTLDLTCRSHQYNLPLSVFSLHHLTTLSLNDCELDLDLAICRLRSLTSLTLIDVTICKETFPHLELKPAFSGLGCLTSLCLTDVNIYRETFLHLVSTSPIVKSLNLTLWDEENGGEALDFDIIELFKFFPVIEHLSISCWTFRGFEDSAQDVVPRELPTTLVHLKSLCMFEMMFVHEFQLLALFILIRSSPNLEKIKLEQEIVNSATDLTEPEMKSLDDYSDIWLEHLHDLEIENFSNLELELEFVKLILAKSPMLKNVRLRLSKWVKNDVELKILRTLIRCRRASPFAEVIVERLK